MLNHRQYRFTTLHYNSFNKTSSSFILNIGTTYKYPLHTDIATKCYCDIGKHDEVTDQDCTNITCTFTIKLIFYGTLLKEVKNGVQKAEDHHESIFTY